MEVKKVAIVGSGQVGTSIGNLWLQYGRTVILRDIAEPILTKARASIEGSVGRRVTKKELTPAQQEETLKRLKTTTNLSDLKDVDLVIEALPENAVLKQNVFTELDAICSEKTILATNSSSIPITLIGSKTKRQAKGKTVKFHFMYPAQVLSFVELARGYLTNDDTWETVKKLSKELNRKPIGIIPDYQGMGNDWYDIEMEIPRKGRGAFYSELMLGKVTLAELETRRTGDGGVFNVMEMDDFIGLDTVLGIQQATYEEYSAPAYAPSPLLKRMVEARHLGQKTGIGFYDYSESPRKAIPGKFSPYIERFLTKAEVIS